VGCRPQRAPLPAQPDEVRVAFCPGAWRVHDEQRAEPGRVHDARRARSPGMHARTPLKQERRHQDGHQDGYQDGIDGHCAHGWPADGPGQHTERPRRAESAHTRTRRGRTHSQSRTRTRARPAAATASEPYIASHRPTDRACHESPTDRCMYMRVTDRPNERNAIRCHMTHMSDACATGTNERDRPRRHRDRTTARTSEAVAR
jgi:hypothetical protein